MQMIRTRNGSSRRRFTVAYFQQNDPHPDPLPSDGRGNGQTCLSQFPKRLDTPTDGGRFSLSHPMGEGRGEGECAPKSEVVFARVLRSSDSLLCRRVKKMKSGRSEGGADFLAR